VKTALYVKVLGLWIDRATRLGFPWAPLTAGPAAPASGRKIQFKYNCPRFQYSATLAWA
jgi:hypothetical protein